jgi:protein-L-isoaspartate(D-aspartate) O-methyltransferase
MLRRVQSDLPRSWLRPFRATALMLMSLWSRDQPNAAATEEDYAQERERMVSRQIEARGISDPRVVAAMRKVPRHLFVPEAVRSSAYSDAPLPIGEGQTISQPYIVALMTDLARPGQNDRALEVGTGSGYQAAVLANLVGHVYSIELEPELARRAEALLHELQYENITVRSGDGYAGWPEAAPFDVIIVTAAPDHVPQPLIEQLKRGGRLVIPVGKTFAVQQLQVLEKDASGRINTSLVTPVRFVPLRRR